MLEQSLKCQEVLKREGCSRDPRLPQSWCEERLVEITPCGKSERPRREKAVREELLQNEVIPLARSNSPITRGKADYNFVWLAMEREGARRDEELHHCDI